MVDSIQLNVDAVVFLVLRVDWSWVWDFSFSFFVKHFRSSFLFSLMQLWGILFNEWMKEEEKNVYIRFTYEKVINFDKKLVSLIASANLSIWYNESKSNQYYIRNERNKRERMEFGFTQNHPIFIHRLHSLSHWQTVWWCSALALSPLRPILLLFNVNRWRDDEEHRRKIASKLIFDLHHQFLFEVIFRGWKKLNVEKK